MSLARRLWPEILLLPRRRLQSRNGGSVSEVSEIQGSSTPCHAPRQPGWRLAKVRLSLHFSSSPRCSWDRSVGARPWGRCKCDLSARVFKDIVRRRERTSRFGVRNAEKRTLTDVRAIHVFKRDPGPERSGLRRGNSARFRLAQRGNLNQLCSSRATRRPAHASRAVPRNDGTAPRADRWRDRLTSCNIVERNHPSGAVGDMALLDVPRGSGYRLAATHRVSLSPTGILARTTITASGVRAGNLILKRNDKRSVCNACTGPVW